MVAKGSDNHTTNVARGHDNPGAHDGRDVADQAGASLFDAAYPRQPAGAPNDGTVNKLFDPALSPQEKLVFADYVAHQGMGRFSGPDGRKYEVDTKKYGNRESVDIQMNDGHGHSHPVLRGIVRKDGSVTEQTDSRGKAVGFAGDWVKRNAPENPLLQHQPSDAAGYVKPGEGRDLYGYTGDGQIVTPPGRTAPDGQTIPDVLRPMLKPGSDFGPEKLNEYGSKYADSVKKLYDLPRTYQGQDGDTFPTVAEKILKERSALTGERVTPDNVAKEAERLQKLNPGVTDLNGAQITTYNPQDLEKIAKTEAVFGKTPPAGQFFKLANPNITEDDIKQALKAQSENKSLKLGEILQSPDLMAGHNVMTKEEVDSALGAQDAWKAYLKGVYQQITPELTK